MNLGNIAGGGEIELFGLPELVELNFQHCKNLAKLHLHDLPKLQHIDVQGLSPPESIVIERIGELDNFVFAVSHYDKIKPQVTLHDVPKLAQIDVEFAKSLSVKGVPKLSYLAIRLGTPMDNSELQQLTALDNARLYGMKGKTIPLDRWPKLHVLMTDAILLPEHLENLPQINRCIYGDASRLTDADFAHLRGHPNLKIVRLTSCGQLTDKCLEHMGTVSKLSHLHLPVAQFTDEGLAHLSGCNFLEDISFDANKQLTGTGFQHLWTLPNLTRVSVHNCGLTAAGERVVRALPKLTHLQIGSVELQQ